MSQGAKSPKDLRWVDRLTVSDAANRKYREWYLIFCYVNDRSFWESVLKCPKLVVFFIFRHQIYGTKCLLCIHNTRHAWSSSQVSHWLSRDTTWWSYCVREHWQWFAMYFWINFYFSKMLERISCTCCFLIDICISLEQSKGQLRCWRPNSKVWTAKDAIQAN